MGQYRLQFYRELIDALLRFTILVQKDVDGARDAAKAASPLGKDSNDYEDLTNLYRAMDTLWAEAGQVRSALDQVMGPPEGESCEEDDSSKG